MNKNNDHNINFVLDQLERDLDALKREIFSNLRRADFISIRIFRLKKLLYEESINHDSGSVNHDSGTGNGVPINKKFYKIHNAKIRKNTIKDYIVHVLYDSESGLNALNILEEINHRYNTDYTRTSLSPQLSRLKYDKVIDLRGNKWFLIRNPKLDDDNII